MRKVIFIMFVLAISFATNSEGAVEVRGARSCGVWVKDRAEKSEMRVNANQTWLVGFLSGLALGTDSNFLKHTDNDSLYLWVDNYCQKNPLNDIDDAGQELAIELMKRKQ